MPLAFLCHFQLSNNGLKYINRLQLFSLPNSDTSSLHLGLQSLLLFVFDFLWTEMQSFCLHLLLKAISPQPQPRPLVSHQAHLHLAQKIPTRAFHARPQSTGERSFCNDTWWVPRCLGGNRAEFHLKIRELPF